MLVFSFQKTEISYKNNCLRRGLVEIYCFETLISSKPHSQLAPFQLDSAPLGAGNAEIETLNFPYLQ